MALYEVVITTSGNSNGVKKEKGMSVEVICNNHPISYNGGKLVYEAFDRKYGVDSKKGNFLLNGAYKLMKK
jgi:hypothetical protein